MKYLSISTTNIPKTNYLVPEGTWNNPREASNNSSVVETITYWLMEYLSDNLGSLRMDLRNRLSEDYE